MDGSGGSAVSAFCDAHKPHTQLHRLLVSLLARISAQAEPPLHVRLHNKQRVTTPPQLQSTGTEGPRMVWHCSRPEKHYREWVLQSNGPSWPPMPAPPR